MKKDLMKENSMNFPPEVKQLIRLAKEVSRETRMPAYLVGGFLRDLLLGRRDWDLDIAVEGDGIKFAEILAVRSGAGLTRHERFGTATLSMDHKLKVDIATTRKELYPASACLPVVSSGTLVEDLFRRDFTINAMALNVSGAAGRGLIDIYHGKSDLASGRIRVLHKMSFKDDPTRILRAIRFKQRYGFRIEPVTLRLLKDAVSSGLLGKVHPHRLRDELILMFKEEDPAGQLKQLCALAGLSFISGKLKADKRACVLFGSIRRQIGWFMRNFPVHGKFQPWLVYFAALLSQLTLSQSRKAIRRLGLSRQEEKVILSCRLINPRLIRSLKEKNVKPAQIFNLLKPLSYEALIFLCSISPEEALKRRVSDFVRVYNCVRLCISGDDLCRMGLEPGPRYQQLLNKVLSARLNGRVRNRRQELVLIGKLMKYNNGEE